MTPAALLELFADAATAARNAVVGLSREERLQAGSRPGQYALDLAADDAVVRVLEKAPVAIVSEESGRGGAERAPVTVVVDPIDGSTNCSRGVPYWATSLAALDGDGVLAALVVNHPADEWFTATRGGGAFLDDRQIAPSGREHAAGGMVTVIGPGRFSAQPWAQSRLLGAAAAELCEVAAGRLDGFADGYGRLSPWDYLGGALVCAEAGASVADARDRALDVSDPGSHRQVFAAATPALLAELRGLLR